MPPKKNQILLTVCSPAHNKTIGVTIITIWYLCEICYIFQNFGLHRDHSSGCARPKFWIEKYCKLDQWRTWIPRYAEEANWSIFIPSFLDFVSYINSSKLLFIFFENIIFFSKLFFDIFFPKCSEKTLINEIAKNMRDKLLIDIIEGKKIYIKKMSGFHPTKNLLFRHDASSIPSWRVIVYAARHSPYSDP